MYRKQPARPNDRCSAGSPILAVSESEEIKECVMNELIIC